MSSRRTASFPKAIRGGAASQLSEILSEVSAEGLLSLRKEREDNHLDILRLRISHALGSVRGSPLACTPAQIHSHRNLQSVCVPKSCVTQGKLSVQALARRVLGTFTQRLQHQLRKGRAVQCADPEAQSSRGI